MSEEKERPRIFIGCHTVPGETDLQAYALADDGKVIAWHISSTEGWARHDMGLTSDRKHDQYHAHYPDGYQLVDVVDARDRSLNLDYLSALDRARDVTPSPDARPRGDQ